MKTSLGSSLAERSVQYPVDAVEVLREMYDLLEEFGPGWYPEELSRKAATVLEVHQR